MTFGECHEQNTSLTATCSEFLDYLAQGHLFRARPLYLNSLTSPTMRRIWPFIPARPTSASQSSDSSPSSGHQQNSPSQSSPIMVSRGACENLRCNCSAGLFFTTGGPIDHTSCEKCGHSFLKHKSTDIDIEFDRTVLISEIPPLLQNSQDPIPSALLNYIALS
jgi:hypothetical protein